jgi:hypothetical protein
MKIQICQAKRNCNLNNFKYNMIAYNIFTADILHTSHFDFISQLPITLPRVPVDLRFCRLKDAPCIVNVCFILMQLLQYKTI